mgnify:CR=1 FL=1
MADTKTIKITTDEKQAEKIKILQHTTLDNLETIDRKKNPSKSMLLHVLKKNREWMRKSFFIHKAANNLLKKYKKQYTIQK